MQTTKLSRRFWSAAARLGLVRLVGLAMKRRRRGSGMLRVVRSEKITKGALIVAASGRDGEPFGIMQASTLQCVFGLALGLATSSLACARAPLAEVRPAWGEPATSPALKMTATASSAQPTALSTPSRAPTPTPSGVPTPSSAERGTENGKAAAMLPGLQPSAKFHAWPQQRELPTTQPRPCVYAGTLLLQAGLLASNAELATRALRMTRLDIKSLDLPARSDEAVRIEAAWPLTGTYWLIVDEPPFQLAARQDLVRGHIWLPKGTSVSASQSGSTRARIKRPAPAASDNAAPQIDLDIDCKRLAFKGSLGQSGLPREAKLREFVGTVLLSPAPGGNPIGRLPLPEPTSFQVLGVAGGWTRIVGVPVDSAFEEVTSYVPYAFDAWTQSASREGSQSGSGGLGLSGNGPSHRTIASLSVSHQPRSGAVVATLARGAVFAAGAVRDSGFISVGIPGISAAMDQERLWVSEAELATAALPLPD